MKHTNKDYVIGIDFGTLSARAVLVNAKTGEVEISTTSEYPHKVIYEALPTGTPLPDLFALQHPNDYLLALKDVISQCFDKTGIHAEAVKAICIDFTSCTILPCKKDGTPLCTLEKFKNNPHAYVKLWKHHAAQSEADLITSVCNENAVSLIRVGGKVSSESLFPKVLEIYNKSREVFDEADFFIEAGDWLSLMLTGKRTASLSFLAYKGLWNEKSGFISDSVIEKIRPALKGCAGGKLTENPSPIAKPCGAVDKRGSEMFSLKEGTIVATPVIDALAPMAALSVTEEKNLLMIVGTSSILALHSKEEKKVDGITGLGYESVIPGYYTYEAGQASVGDTFEWFIENALPASYYEEAKNQNKKIHKYLREKASALSPAESGLIFLDWLNGNRSTLTDARLTGLLLGLDLNTKPEEIYRALIEGTAYGARVIFENFINSGLEIEKITASGGISQKDPMMMQIYADVLNCEIFVPSIEFSGSYGSALYAATAAGFYPDIKTAADCLKIKDGTTYRPIAKNVEIYNKLFDCYYSLYRHFGKDTNVMKALLDLKSAKSI